MVEKRYYQTIGDAYRESLRDLDDTLLMGEDVRKAFLGTSLGLVDEFGENRVLDTPISEESITGAAAGAAMMGKRPIVEYQISPLPYIAMDQLVNYAGKVHHMSDGDVSVPLTVTSPLAGVPGGSAAQHSDNPHSALMHFGIKTVIPSSPYDVKGLFRTAVEEDDPVMIYYPTSLHGITGDVPEEPYRIPFGEANVVREGDDVTVVAIGETVPHALAVADELQGEASVEVIDPRSLVPLDEETIFESVRKTGRVVVAESANRTCGTAGEIAARIANEEFWSLEAPIKRVTRADVPVAYTPLQEQYMIPDEGAVLQAISDVLGLTI